ncbi:MAG: hypothetical protein J6M17_10320 [Ruminococcus sp.]|nr:hypothetical protein [Ruminococcus sp.]
MTKETYKAFMTEHLVALEELSKDKEIYDTASLTDIVLLIKTKIEVADILYRLENE